MISHEQTSGRERDWQFLDNGESFTVSLSDRANGRAGTYSYTIQAEAEGGATSEVSGAITVENGILPDTCESCKFEGFIFCLSNDD